MAHRSGEAREQTALFPVMLDDLVGENTLVRVIDAWVSRIDLGELGFTKVHAQSRGAPPYDPADLLKLYIWGYSNASRSSRVLERECHRNVECMWLLRRLAPDHKTIANFRSQNANALVATCALFVEFASRHQLIKSRTVAVDGSKVRAVASCKSLLTKEQLDKRGKINAEAVAKYLEQLDVHDRSEEEPHTRRADVESALNELKEQSHDIEQQIGELSRQGRSTLVHSEPEAQMMRSLHAPGYNLQTAVEAQSHLIVHHDVCADANDLRQLQPIAQAAATVLRQAVAPLPGECGPGQVIAIADSGYANASHVAALGEQDIVTFVAPNSGVNPHGLFDKSMFAFDARRQQYTCPAGKVLARKKRARNGTTADYTAKLRDCSDCHLKPQCTTGKRRHVTRHVHEDVMQANAHRVEQHPEMMKLRRQVVEHPFGTLKHGILRNARLLMRGLQGAKGELSLAVLVYNIKRVFSMMGGAWMKQAAQG